MAFLSSVGVLKVTFVGLIGALTYFIALSAVELATSESRYSAFREAYMVLSNRYLKLIRDGHIEGETFLYRPEVLPKIGGNFENPNLLGCDLQVQFSSLNTDHFKSETIIVVGPYFDRSDGRGSVAVVYQGDAENFAPALDDNKLGPLFSAGSGKVENLHSEYVVREDRSLLYKNFLKQRNIDALSRQCDDFAITVFHFNQ